MPDKKKVGSHAVDLLLKADNNHTVIDQMQENLTDYDTYIYNTIENAKRIAHQDFYIVVIFKKEPLLENTLRNYFFWRYSCPTPDYDQVVYKYHYQEQIIEFLWVIPSKDTCLYLKDNALQVHESERGLLNFVLRFSDGELYTLCKKLNGELPTTNELIEGV